MSEPLKYACPRIFQCRGATYEGDVFSVLKHSSITQRAFEFGLVDGGVDCSRSYTTSSWAERYWDLHQRRHLPEASRLVLFDVKSTVGQESGDQKYVTTVAQRRHVAFYIGINAADPTFVDVIPNYDQVPEALIEEESKYVKDVAGKQGVSVHVARESLLPTATYGGIDQSLSPYRMPLAWLPVAIEGIRECALNEDVVFVNPWTGVAYTGWRPLTTTLTKFLRPPDDADQATAYEAVLEIYRTIQHTESSLFDVDFVGIQPSLADFKFISRPGHLRQYFFQHKFDTTLRAKGSSLSRVSICRDGRYYFSAYDRFDFLWYQFTFSKGPPEVEYVFYLIPECMLPNEFFTTRDTEVNFGPYRQFDDYRVVLDDGGAWLRAIERIILRHPDPRHRGERPLRNFADPALESLPSQPIPASLAEPTALEATATTDKSHGRHVFAEMTAVGLRTFFYKVLEQCALRLSGLLIVLATNHPWGEFGFCRYGWSPQERLDFLRSGNPPRACHNLPSDTEIVPLYFFTQHAEALFQGPNIRPQQYRRLNASKESRLVVWDIGGPDTANRTLRPAVIPTNDFAPSDKQRALFERNLALDKTKGRDQTNPSLSATLNTGLYAAEYSVGDGGPLAYDSEPWGKIWELLDRFTGLEEFEHPVDHVREPSHFRHTIKDALQRLHEQYRHGQPEDLDGPAQPS